MLRFLFSLIPWWVFAALAASFAPLSLSMYEDYEYDKFLMDEAIYNGPLDVIPVRKFGDAFANEPFGEVRLSGTLRADLGVLGITFSETRYSVVVLDDTTTGPVVAIMIPEGEAGAKLPMIVESADDAGRVTVQGFLAPFRAGEMSRQLAVRNGISREVYVVEPYFGSREGALSSKVSDSLIGFSIFAGVTAFFALMAVWRFFRWRKRRTTKRAQRPKQTAQPAASEAKHVSTRAQQTEASPWGTFQPQPKTQPSGNNRMVKPQTPEQAKATAKAKPKPSRPRDTDAIPAEPEFESVFPGGGSGFRFKTADEIIRQTFGTLSALEYRKPKE